MTSPLTDCVSERPTRPVLRDSGQFKVPSLTAELFVISLDRDRYLVYAPLRRAAFVGNARTVNFIADLREGILDAAADPDGSLVELLRRMEILDAGPEPLPISEFTGPPEPTTVSLFLTTACNLRCTYCYAAAGDTPTKFMPVEIATRGIEFVARNAKRKGLPGFEINYHGGGEPTVNWRTMVESHAFARQLAADYGIGVEAFTATNGVLKDEQIDWIVANLQGASLSFDGLPDVHDCHRPTVSGHGSSAEVIRTIRRFDAAGFPYGIRVTVTADQIPRMVDSVEFICANFRVQRIQVEPAYQIGRWANAPSAETEGFISGFREAQARAAKHGREILFSAARVGTLTNHFCGISQDSFALSPDGNVSACYETFSEDNPWSKVFFYGKPDPVNGGYQFDLGRLNHLRRQAVQHRDYCQGCFAKWTCAGDCYHKSLTVNGSLQFQGTERCNITRELTKDQILDRIARSGALFWHEPPPDGEQASPAGKEFLI